MLYNCYDFNNFQHIFSAEVSKHKWSPTDVCDSVAHLLRIARANGFKAEVKSLKMEGWCGSAVSFALFQ